MRNRTMKKTIIILTVTALLGATISPVWGGEALLTDGNRLFSYISNEDQYLDWNLWPGQEKQTLASGPYGFWMTTYVNPTAYIALIGKEDSLPPGSIIVNESYSFDGELKVIRVMYKEAGYNPGAGDWFFAMYGPGGDVRNEGRVDLCIGCHRFAEETDNLLTDYPEGYKGTRDLASAAAPGLASAR